MRSNGDEGEANQKEKIKKVIDLKGDYDNRLQLQVEYSLRGYSGPIRAY